MEMFCGRGAVDTTPPVGGAHGHQAGNGWRVMLAIQMKKHTLSTHPTVSLLRNIAS
jgi:hypothetical protein